MANTLHRKTVARVPGSAGETSSSARTRVHKTQHTVRQHTSSSSRVRILPS
jgi:hypothetical protein